MILVDSSVWIDYFNNRSSSQTDTLHQILGDKPVGVLDLIAIEVLQGFRSQTDFRMARPLFQALGHHSFTGMDAAVRSAERYRILKSKGITIRNSLDCMIAGYCIDHKIPLLFSDRDFEPFVEHFGLQAVV